MNSCSNAVANYKKAANNSINSKGFCIINLFFFVTDEMLIQFTLYLIFYHHSLHKTHKHMMSRLTSFSVKTEGILFRKSYCAVTPSTNFIY